VLGTIEDVVDELREQGVKIGAVSIKCFRPWPREEVRKVLRGANRVVVIEKAFAVGAGGIVGQNVRLALSGLTPVVFDIVAGLGGRPITRRSLRTLLGDVLSGRIEPGDLHFLDLKTDVVQRELARVAAGGLTGPHAESILREIAVGARSH